jgi:hypothetical protein
LAPQPDSLALVFPLHYEAPQDAAIAAAFLQQFPEARRSGGGASSSPSCSYTPAVRVSCCRPLLFAAGRRYRPPPAG